MPYTVMMVAAAGGSTRMGQPKQHILLGQHPVLIHTLKTLQQVDAIDEILLIARQEEIENGLLDTAKVKAFKVPAGVLVEVYATTLHYAPCHCDSDKGFRVLVALPWLTNTDRPVMTNKTPEDEILTARNKWLLAHPESNEAKNGAKVGLTGINIDLEG